MPSLPRAVPSLLAALSLLSAGTAAQWVANPALNVALADAASDQAQPKLVATADGGAWLSWFDGIGSGYDVRLQRLDEDGAELLPHAGVLVADLSLSSTQDYGLSLASNGDALLTFQDDRLTGVQITAARIASDGSAAWGPLGVQLTNTGAFVASPRIAGTADGGAVVAWTQDNSTRLRKLNAAGAPAWAADIVLTPATGSDSISDLQASGNDVIASIVWQTGPFGSPRRILTQKYNASGAPLWSASPVAVFDTGSLQFGNFPAFVLDGAGGAVFSWYTTSPLQCFAQRILANGSEGFAHNGVAVSSNATQIRVSPWASFDSASGATVVSWVEGNSLQSQFGLSSQKFDASGNKLWGAQGKVHLPLGASEISNVRNAFSAGTVFVFWESAPSFGQGVLRGLRVAGAAGTTLLGPFDVSSTPSSKSRLAIATSSHGHALLAWSDDRVDENDIYGQNVNCDGTLGPASTTAAWSNLGNALAGQAGLPALVGSGTLCAGDDYSLTLSGARANSVTALIVGFTALNAPFKGGVLVPNPNLIFAGLPTGPLGTLAIAGSWPPGVPAQFSLFFQHWITDAAGPHGFAASNGISATTP